MGRKKTVVEVIPTAVNNRVLSEFLNKDLIVFLKIENLPPLSLNSIYPTSRSGHRFLSDEGRVFKDTIMTALANYVIENKFEDYQGFKFHCSLEICFGFSELYFKNGGIKRNDVSNYIKPIEDAIAEFFGYDDAYNFEVIARKYYSEVPRIDIKLYKLL